MSDRLTTLLLARLRAMAERKQRFSYDVRGHAYVNSGMVATYGLEGRKGEPADLATVLQHALAHDAIVSGVKDPISGKTRFTSDRLFSDTGNAVRFAKMERQATVYNWNREEEIPVDGSQDTGTTSPAVEVSER